MELEVGLSNRSPHGFEKLNDGNYATWAFDVKYQFLKEKLWGVVSATESPPVRRVPVSKLETADLVADAADALLADEEHRAALSEWEDKVNAAYLIFVTTIVGQLQACSPSGKSGRCKESPSRSIRSHWSSTSVRVITAAIFLD